jgi:hypothetical protein
MGAYAAVSKWSLLRLSGTQQQKAESEGRRWADREGIAEPERWRAMLAPGFP